MCRRVRRTSVPMPVGHALLPRKQARAREGRLASVADLQPGSVGRDVRTFSRRRARVFAREYLELSARHACKRESEHSAVFSYTQGPVGISTHYDGLACPLEPIEPRCES